MTRIMTLSRDSRLAPRLAVAAIAALLWVVSHGAVSASAAPGKALGHDNAPSSEDNGRSGDSNGQPGSVRWR